MKSTNEIPFSSVTDNPVWMADMMYVYNLNAAAPERSVYGTDGRQTEKGSDPASESRRKKQAISI